MSGRIETIEGLGTIERTTQMIERRDARRLRPGRYREVVVWIARPIDGEESRWLKRYQAQSALVQADMEARERAWKESK